MSVKRKAALLHAAEFCGTEGGCDQCPYLGGPCDMPFIEYVRLPVHVLKDLRTELLEPETPWMFEPDDKTVQ